MHLKVKNENHMNLLAPVNRYFQAKFSVAVLMLCQKAEWMI